MKLYKIAKKIINETISNIVYHYTTMNSAIQILTGNKLIASDSQGKDKILNKGFPYYISTTRIKHSHIFKSNVKIVINGEKLNHKYKSCPIDYYGGAKPRLYKNIHDEICIMKADEAEDRILLKIPYIDNFSQYIIKIEILADDSTKRVFRLIDVCQENGIPLLVYKNENDFLIGNSKKAKIYK